MKRFLFWEALILSALFLYLSRTYTISLYLFLPLYFFLVYDVLHSEERTLQKLTALSMLTAISLSLRFDHLIWGDPWSDYAINKGILESKLFPLSDEEPVARALTVMASMLTGIDPMTVQKFLIPAMGSLAVPTLYLFMQDFMPERGALYSGLLLMVATPYLHWVTQGVRESLGLFLVVLALYLAYRAIKESSRKNILFALISAAVLPMTHPRAALIFLTAWIGFSFFYLLHDPSKKKSFYAAVISIFALGYSFRWWELTNSRGLKAIEKFLLNHNASILEGYLIAAAILILLYLFTTRFKLPLETWLTKKRKIIYYTGLTGIFIMLVYIMIFSHKNFALPYPVSYFIGTVIMFSFGIVGVYCLFEKGRTPIAGWILGLSMLLVLNLILNYGETVTSDTSPAGDPLRFFTHLSVPLAGIAGMGFLFIEKKTGNHIDKLLFPFAILIILMTSFPSIAFVGETFSKDTPFIYDERSWLINHADRDISSTEWLKDYNNGYSIISDRYNMYTLRPVGLYFRFGIEERNLSSKGYVLITDRMLHITDFGETFYSKRKGLDIEQIEEIEERTDKLYSNNYAYIYLR